MQPQTSLPEDSSDPFRGGLMGTLLSLAQAAHVDRAVIFAVAYRAYQAVTGLGSLVVIPLFLTGEVQGYYFTFTSLLAFSALLELGLHIAIMNTASHEWAQLKLDAQGRIEGSPEALSRLVSLGRQVFAWYAGAAGLFAIGLGCAGYVFFAKSSGATQVAWQGPWLALVALTALGIWAMPFVIILEGCNQVAQVFKYRLLLAPMVTAALWGGMFLGLGLWSVPMASAATLGVDLLILLGKYGRFWQPFVRAPQASHVNWKTEIWPMQWRLAASSVGGYLMFSLYNPVIFHYHGPVEAGRMGMTLAMITALQGLGMAWAQTKAPQFGVLVAQKNFHELDRRFFRITGVSTGVVMLGGIVMCLLTWFVGWQGWKISERILPVLPTAVLGIYAALMQVSYCQSFYLRAHKCEPLMAISLVCGAAQGLLVWWWGAQWGGLGQAAASLAVVALLALPWETAIWLHARRHWH